MSKLIPFLFAGVGESTGNNTGNSDKGSTSEDTSKDLEFDSLTNFEKKGGTCVKQLFGQEMNLSTTTGNPNTVVYDSIANDLNPASSTDKTKNKSCLIINYEKKGEENKWTGTFTWTWVFANETKGFVVFVLAKTPTNPAAKKMKVEGGVYILSKDGSSNWQVTKKKTVADTEGKEIDKSKLTTDKNLPKPASSLQDATQSYWGFLSGADELEKICTESPCPTTPFNNNGKYKEQWEWTGQESGGQKLREWSEDMDWFKNIFGDSAEKLKGHLESLSGSWTKKTTPAA